MLEISLCIKPVIFYFSAEVHGEVDSILHAGSGWEMKGRIVLAV